MWTCGLKYDLYKAEVSGTHNYHCYVNHRTHMNMKSVNRIIRLWRKSNLEC